jgi:hypothetical protein
MAEVSTVVQQPPEFIEAAAKPYLTQLQQVTGGLKEADLSQIYGPQYVAGLGALTQQAIGQAGGLGAYAPYLQAAQAATGPTAYQAYMSPYQQDVIGSTLQEYDIQAQKGLPTLAAQAIGAGAFGGGREGVQRAEYQSASDRNRAALQAQLLQQGFGQAQQSSCNNSMVRQYAISSTSSSVGRSTNFCINYFRRITTSSSTGWFKCSTTISTATIYATASGYTGSGFRNHFIDCWISRFNTNNNAAISNTFTNCFRCRCYISRSIQSIYLI